MLFKKKHSIGNTIAKLRKEKGWSQLELAEKLQVSDKAISKWESNKGIPSMEFFPVMAELFGVTLDYLITGKETNVKNVIMSRLELCAKNDDVDLYHSLGLSSNYKDENGKSILDYIFKYQSKSLFLDIINKEKFPNRDKEFYENVYYMRLLCNDKTVIRDLIRLEYAETTIDNHLNYYANYICYNGNGGFSVLRKIISDRIIDYILYSNELDESIRNAMISNHHDSKAQYYSPSFLYPYIVLYSLKKHDYKFAQHLIENAVEFNLENSKISGSNEKYIGFVNFPKEVFDLLLNEEKYELIELANKANKIYFEKFQYNELYRKSIYILSSYEIDANKIKHNCKLSEKEKELMLCVHDGILCLDELIALNDFDLYEKTINKLPMCVYEDIFSAIRNKNYKKVFEFANLKKLNSLIRDFQIRNEENLEKDFEDSFRGDIKFDLNKEINAKYIKVILSKSGYPSYITKVTYDCFIKAKNYVFLQDVLDKDIRFIEKACATATQEELDEALKKIEPSAFEKIRVLLDHGALLHKTFMDDEGYYEDFVDSIETEILKKKIKDILGD